jgi:hypothetical protein
MRLETGMLWKTFMRITLGYNIELCLSNTERVVLGSFSLCTKSHSFVALQALVQQNRPLFLANLHASQTETYMQLSNL